MNPEGLRISIFADGADRDGMLAMYRHPLVKGFTTNPTLMRAAGVVDFEAFARGIIADIPDRPISFEVFSDEFDEMARQARKIAAWGSNAFVKIPVTNTHGASAAPLVRELAEEGIQLNVTAIMTVAQVETMAAALRAAPRSYVSLFAGRIADSGRDPCPIVRDALAILAPHPQMALIWASPREILNLVQAEALGVHVITMTNDLIAKLPLLGKELEDFSLDTVRMFYRDAAAAAYVV